jgi:hypothetical protein
MLITQLRLAIACSMVAAVAVTVLCGEPASHRIAEHRSQPVAAEQNRSAFRSSAIWLEEMSQPIRRRDLRLEPAASCAATACHGGPRPGIAEDLAVRGAEYPLWLENDPHAQSWRTLCSKKSIAILERLSIMRGGKIVDSTAFDNCLACHNSAQGYDVEGDLSDGGFIEEGVGCASCHGPPQNWRGDHYRMQRDDASNAALGLSPIKNLYLRARICAACHVGDSDRDMNHDIIAAGHPALHYEFATFHNMLPKHWREPERTRSPDFEAHLWLAGQVAALDASLALLDSRAARHLSISTWPEFAATDCSACHQNLRLREADGAGASMPSTAKFSTWNRFGVDQLLRLNRSEGKETVAAQQLALSLDRLSKLMSDRTLPDAVAVQAAARTARQDLDVWLRPAAKSDEHPFSAGSFSAESLQRLAAKALADSERLERWEYTAQSYLAFIAARRSWMGSSSAGILSDASQLRHAILFRPGTQSLALPDEPNREIRSTAARLAQALKQLRQVSLLPGSRESSSSGGTPDPIFQLRSTSFSD